MNMGSEEVGVGKALRYELEPERKLPALESAGGRVWFSPLIHPFRRKLLEYLCRYPGSIITKICTELRATAPTVRWHLRKLGAYVRATSVSGRNVFFVAGHVGEKELETLMFLNNRIARAVVLSVMKKPGIQMKDMPTPSRWYLRAALSYGLISAVSDGKTYRYYPTDRLEKLAAENRRRLGLFRRYILRRLTEDGLEPKIERLRKELLVIRIKCPEPEILVLRTDPFATVLGDYQLGK